MWTGEPEKALQLCKQNIKEYSNLHKFKEDTIIDIIHKNGYGTWGIYNNTSKPQTVGLYCKRFPFVENRYSLFEKTAWTAYETLKMTSTMTIGKMTLRTPITLKDWIKMTPKET